MDNTHQTYSLMSFMQPDRTTSISKYYRASCSPAAHLLETYL